jgi:hypothetical protein
MVNASPRTGSHSQPQTISTRGRGHRQYGDFDAESSLHHNPVIAVPTPLDCSNPDYRPTMGTDEHLLEAWNRKATYCRNFAIFGAPGIPLASAKDINADSRERFNAEMGYNTAM